MPTLFEVIIFLFIGTFAYAAYRAAPWVPTKNSDTQRIAKLLKLEPNEIFFDLGCGDGKIVEIASLQGAKAIGFEISLFPYLLAQIRGIILRFKNRKNPQFGSYTIKFQDFLNQDLSSANTIYFFLTKKVCPALEKKFRSELKKGTTVISYVWQLKNIKPIEISTQPKAFKIYIYKF